jgi:8-oxo-dGTP pyrophosphatase MutT (NUDIX family)
MRRTGRVRRQLEGAPGEFAKSLVSWGGDTLTSASDSNKDYRAMDPNFLAASNTRLNLSVDNESPDWLFWETVSREKLVDCKIFSVSRIEAAIKCDDKRRGTFFTVNCGPWVNIIAVTDQKRLVMVEQYRHGIEALTLEIPGGSIDDTDIDPQAAAMRELREETGCVADSWSFIGKNHPNPALQDNLCYTYLAEGVRQIEEPQFDNSGTERIKTRYYNLCDINSLIREGTVSNGLVIVAFHFLTLIRPDLMATETIPGIQ